jgi:hypothetical protein
MQLYILAATVKIMGTFLEAILLQPFQIFRHSPNFVCGITEASSGITEASSRQSRFQLM